MWKRLVLVLLCNACVISSLSTTSLRKKALTHSLIIYKFVRGSV